MKTIVLLGIAATLALGQEQKAVNPDVSSKPSATRDQTTKPVPPVRPNMGKGEVPPKYPELTPEQKAAAALPTVPKGAQPVGPNLFRYTDPQGKTWMYRQTPFGVSKWEEKPGDEQQADTPKPLPATATDLGDSVQFERDTPFGHQKWIVKKSEMTDDEKATLAAQQQAKPAPAVKNDAVKNDAAKNSEKQ